MSSHLKFETDDRHNILFIRMSCDYCEAKFVRKDTYRSHILSHHQDMDKSELDDFLKKIRNMKPGKEMNKN